MSDILFAFLCYVGKLLALTLGIFAVCGFAVHLCSRAFARLIGSGSDSVFDLTAVIGTPIHELGHAAMCLLFAHKIQDIKLLGARVEQDGVYGYVEHSYNRKNPWARMGNLFIGLGPIFSGLGVVILMLWLCFPVQWNGYLTTTSVLIGNAANAKEVSRAALSLLFALPDAFVQDPVRALIGLLVILSVSLHIRLSAADLLGCLSALPIYLLLTAVFALVTSLVGVQEVILSHLMLWNLQILSLFALVITFALAWVVIGALIFLLKRAIKWF